MDEMMLYLLWFDCFNAKLGYYEGEFIEKLLIPLEPYMVVLSLLHVASDLSNTPHS